MSVNKVFNKQKVRIIHVSLTNSRTFATELSK